MVAFTLVYSLPACLYASLLYAWLPVRYPTIYRLPVHYCTAYLAASTLVYSLPGCRTLVYSLPGCLYTSLLSAWLPVH
jgi:hypothetical protein